jgi:putative component of toxin-antitoxin plasmid stabilization module
MDGETLVILLGGGTKKRRYRDILRARISRFDYKGRKDREAQRCH